MFGTTCLSTGLYTVPSPYFAYTAVLGLANRHAACSNNRVDAVFGSKRRGLRIGMQRDKGQNHGAPDTSVSGAYPFLGLVTGAQSAASPSRGDPASPDPPLSLAARLMAPADTADDDRLFVPHPITIARRYSNRRNTAAKICERR